MNSSLWGAPAPASFPLLSGEIETDVLIIGGGITGVTAAWRLAMAGTDVVLLEARSIGSGTTGSSTGNLYSTVDGWLHHVREKWGDEVTASVVESRRETLFDMETTIGRHGIDCGFHRRPHHIAAAAPEDLEELAAEMAALQAGGVSVDEAPSPAFLSAAGALRLEDQAQFHPLRYVRSLAELAEAAGCRIFESSPVLELDEGELFARTRQGSVRARRIILATHTPKGFNIIQTELAPYREYAVAAPLHSPYPEGIYWTMAESSHSLRPYIHDGTPFLLVIGELHKTGQHDPGADYFSRVEQYARSRFDLGEVRFRWSAQHYRSADRLPYIGRSVSSPDIFIATGFGTDGLVYGSLAASILADEIAGKVNRWSELYKATRFAPARTARAFATENINVARQYAKDYLTRAQLTTPDAIAAGEGGIVEVDGKQTALYRRPDGEAVLLSPACTHLGCLVHWNRLEKTWDCPCHGSRFTPDGEVIEGPAIEPLREKTHAEEKALAERDGQRVR